MKARVILFVVLFHLGLAIDVSGQKSKSDLANKFPEIKYSNIMGAPKLGKPVLIMGSTKPVYGSGAGWAAPELFDWDSNGKKDLLIGEFGNGNGIKVYENFGSAENPQFSDDFVYAYGISEVGQPFLKELDHLMGTGRPLSIPQACCMAFKPQFIDLNGDGYLDLYSGNYTPGIVVWFRGSEKGFYPGEKLKQKGDPSTERKQNKGNVNDPEDWTYWSYSAVSFGEFTADDLPDMIVGGQNLRISKNIGTRTNPEVSLREELLDSDGKPLWNKIWGATGVIPYIVDWDQDGIPDILASASYTKPGNTAVMFFKGRQKGTSLFEKGIPLFTIAGGGKAFPGDYLNVSVGDWNNDGINDLIIGARVAVLKGKFDHNLNWSWESDRGYLTSKSGPGLYSASKIKEIDEKIKKVEQQEKKLKKELGITEFLKRKKEATRTVDREKYATKEDLLRQYYCGDEKYKTLIHQGYVYVMLGQK